MSIAATKKKTLMKRRKTAIILAAALTLILAIALFLVLDFANTLTYTDVDDSSYYIRKKNGEYAMFDGEREILPYDDQYECYVTEAGTLVKVNAETGAWKIYAVVDTEAYEVVGVNSRILLFPHVKKADILSLEVHNSHGTYTFIRYNERNEADPEGGFVIQASPLTSFSPELFTSLHVGAGYAISLEKLVDPIVDENGNYTEYGLAPEIRVRTTDEKGEELAEPVEYAYEPAYYILTQTNGTQHKVIIGDPLVTGEGYYAQYVELKNGEENPLPGVYVLDLTTGQCVTYPIEEYVTPVLSYPMNTNNYYDVENFIIGQLKEDATVEDESPYEPTISFTYLDLEERTGTVKETAPYQFHLDLDGFTPTTESIDACLYTMYSPSFAEKSVKILRPSNRDLVKYGLAAPVLNEKGEIVKNEKGEDQYVPFAPYRISFSYDVLDDKNKYSFTVDQTILLSRPEDDELNPDGNYFAYTAFREYVKQSDGTEKPILSYSSNMIVEVESHCLEFLKWSKKDWVNASYIHSNISFVSKIELTSPDYNASFTLDNSISAADESESSGSTYLTVTGSDSAGNSAKTFNYRMYLDKNNNLWVITSTGLYVKDPVTKEDKSIAEGIDYYANNKLGQQVRCREGYINCKGYKVQVEADYITVYETDDSGNILSIREKIARYDTDLFRDFYETLVFSTIVDVYEPENDEELEKILSRPLLTMNVTTKDREGTITTSYSFYEISSRKAYITINGNGGFYVYRNRVDKFISDAQRFFAGELIDSTAKK